jgi:translation initiation factor RLI1
MLSDVRTAVCPDLSHRFILHAKKTAFVIEHDFIMATYLADRVIVFEGQPAISATATPYGRYVLRLPYTR